MREHRQSAARESDRPQARDGGAFEPRRRTAPSLRQVFTESVLLASLGGVLGVLFAVWGVRAFTLLLSNGQENFTIRAELNWCVLGVTAALSLLSGVLFGLAPAIRSTRADVGGRPIAFQRRSGGFL